MGSSTHMFALALLSDFFALLKYVGLLALAVYKIAEWLTPTLETAEKVSMAVEGFSGNHPRWYKVLWALVIVMMVGGAVGQEMVPDVGKWRPDWAYLEDELRNLPSVSQGDHVRRTTIKKAAESLASSARDPLQYGMVALGMEKLSEAQLHFQQLVDTIKGDPDKKCTAIYLLGVVRLSSRDTIPAIATFRQALECSRGGFWSRYQLARVLHDRGENEEAKLHIHHAILETNLWNEPVERLRMAIDSSLGIAPATKEP